MSKVKTIPMGNNLHLATVAGRWYVLEIQIMFTNEHNESLAHHRQLESFETREEAEKWCKDFQQNMADIGKPKRRKDAV